MGEPTIENDFPPTPVDRAVLLKFLEDSGFDTITLDHQPLFTVDDSRHVQDKLEGGHTKNLFLKDKKGQYFLLTAEQDTQINLKTLHKLAAFPSASQRLFWNCWAWCQGL